MPLTDAVYVAKRENPIVNRLNKTKEERQVDHEQEMIDRKKKEDAARRSAAAERVRSLLLVFVSSSLTRDHRAVEEDGTRASASARGGEGSEIVRQHTQLF